MADDHPEEAKAEYQALVLRAPLKHRTRRNFLLMTLGALSAPSVVRAQPQLRWRMVTSWSRNMAGPGVSAERIARRIEVMSKGALRIEVHAAGEIVPALQVFDAVSNQTVEMGHSASVFWGGKIPAAPLFCTCPFGLGPTAHAAWIDAKGQALWDEIYAPFNVKALIAGNTGPSSAGWFRKAPENTTMLGGLRIRVSGLGGELYRRLGATPLMLAPGDTYAALERGAIDAAEFLSPAQDLPLGLHRVAPVMVYPGFNKPNGVSELLIGRKHWENLPENLQTIIQAAARMEHDFGLAEAHRLNAEAIVSLLAQQTMFSRWPDQTLAKANTAAQSLLADIAETSSLSRMIVTSYRKAQNEAGRAWDAMVRL